MSMNIKEYSNLLKDILKTCKEQNKNVKIKKIQADMIRGINKDFIIKNLDCYI